MLTRVGVRRLVNRVAKDLGDSPPPPVRFHAGPHSWVNRGVRVINLPKPEFITEYMATTARGYRLLVLHELAHTLWGMGHGAGFYAYLFPLCQLYGVPVSFAVAEEMGYKPRGVTAGLQIYLDQLKNKIERCHDATSDQG